LKSYSSTTTGRNAVALAVIAILGLVYITLFYALFDGSGGPFGSLNDICVALGGILSGVLVWRLHAIHRTCAPRMSRFAVASGLLGAILVPLGSEFAITSVAG